MAALPKMKNVEISALREYGNNPRLHDDAVDKMAKAIEDYGFRLPVLISGDEIVDGHLRYKAAKKLNLKKIPTIDVSDMTPEQIKAFRLLVNKSTEWAEWDNDRLFKEVSDLYESNYDVASLGFTGAEIGEWISKLDQNESFLDDLISDVSVSIPSAEFEAPGPIEDRVTISFVVSAQDRYAIMNMLNEKKEQESLESAAEALVFMARNA